MRVFFMFTSFQKKRRRLKSLLASKGHHPNSPSKKSFEHFCFAHKMRRITVLSKCNCPKSLRRTPILAVPNWYTLGGLHVRSRIPLCSLRRKLDPQLVWLCRVFVL